MDGVFSKTLAYFKDESIARAFADSQKDKTYTKTRPVIVLTDGITAFLIDEKISVTYMDEDEEKLRLKNEALKKLSPEQRELLDLPNPTE
jgi:hypothetical protein